MIRLRSIFCLSIIISYWGRPPCVSAGFGPCHLEYKNDPCNCTEVVIPSGFCSSCQFRPGSVLDSGHYRDCTNIFETDAEQCRDKIKEYLDLNPCDTSRSKSFAQLTNTTSPSEREIGRLKLDYFLYSLCELSCDCMPHAASKNRKGEISVRRENCRAHFAYDICRLFPQLFMMRASDGSMDTMPTRTESVCPKLQKWFDTAVGWMWHDIGSIEPDVAELLYHTVKVMDHSNDVNWNACYEIETKQNRIADADTGWRTMRIKGKTAGRHAACFLWHDDGHAYLVGGLGRKKEPVVSEYDPLLRTWVNHPQSTKAVHVHHAQCVSLGGKIWMPMAWVENDANMNSLAVYDPKKQEWDSSTYPAHPDKRRRRGAGATVVFNGKIYTSHGTSGGQRASATAYLDMFDPVDRSWARLANAAYPRAHTGGAVIRHPDTGRDMFCVAGGRQQSNDASPAKLVAPTECYDFAANTWQTYPDIPTPRAGASYGATCDGKLMVAGGEVLDSGGDGNRALDVVEIFDGKSWTTGPSLKEGRHGSGGIVFDCRPCGEAHITSGNPARGDGPDLTSTEAYFYDREDDTCNWYAPGSASITPPFEPVELTEVSALITTPFEPIVLAEAEFNPTQEIGISILLIVGIICVYLSYSSRSHGWYRHRGQRKQERRILRIPSPPKGPR